MTTQPYKTWTEAMGALTAAQIAERLGCPLSTANCWKRSYRKPPLWAQNKYLPYLQEKKRNAPKKS